MRVKGVHKSFGVDGRLVPVLEGVDVYAAAGELVSIIGPSGLLERTVDGNKAFTKRVREGREIG